MILNPIFCNVDAELIGVAPPSIILATSGALIDLPIFFISPIVSGASTKITSAPISVI